MIKIKKGLSGKMGTPLTRQAFRPIPYVVMTIKNIFTDMVLQNCKIGGNSELNPKKNEDLK